MVKRIGPQRVEEFVKKSLIKANRDYCNLSGGDWVTGRGVESFLAYFVAQPFAKFFSLENVSIKLEVSQKEFWRDHIPQLKLSGGANSNSRFDIVVVRKANDHAVAIVELKREDPKRYPGGYKKDINRVATIVKDCRTSRDFQFGCFAGIVSEKKNEGRIEELRSQWEPSIKRIAKERGIKAQIFRPLDRRFEYNEEDRRYWRYDIIGCVFFT